MKRSLILLTLICSIGLFNACSKNDEFSWKDLPSTEIKGESVMLTVNGQPITGSIQLSAQNETAGVLKLNNVVPGLDNLDINVILNKLSKNSYSFIGEKTVSSMKSTLDGYTTVSVNGSITADDKASVEIKTVASGSLVRTWSFVDSCKIKSPPIYVISSPILLNWPAKNPKQTPNGEQLSSIVGQIAPFALVEVLKEISFNANGTITAKYYPTIILEEGQDIQTWFMSRIEAIGDKFTVSPRKWITSSENYATWYIKGENLYILPNIKLIVNMIAPKIGYETVMAMITEMNTLSDADLKAVITILAAEYGIDLSKLEAAHIRTVLSWIKTGIPLKYTSVDGLLYIHADKKMAAQFMPVILSMMPMLQAEFDKLVATGKDEMFAYLPAYLGVKKFTDFETIWNTNTTDVFEIGIMLK